MYLFAAANIPLAGNIELAFRPPEEKELVHVSAIVRRKVVYLYGIEFLNQSTKDRVVQSAERAYHP